MAGILIANQESSRRGMLISSTSVISGTGVGSLKPPYSGGPTIFSPVQCSCPINGRGGKDSSTEPIPDTWVVSESNDAASVVVSYIYINLAFGSKMNFIRVVIRVTIEVCSYS